MGSPCQTGLCPRRHTPEPTSGFGKVEMEMAISSKATMQLIEWGTQSSEELSDESIQNVCVALAITKCNKKIKKRISSSIQSAKSLLGEMKKDLMNKSYDKLVKNYKKLGKKLLTNRIFFRTLYQEILSTLSIKIFIRTIGEGIPFTFRELSPQN